MLKQKTPPKISDFSHQSINRAVIRTGLSHWLTLYPPAVGIPVGIAGLLFSAPIVSALGFGTVLFSLGSAVVNIFFRNDKIAVRYIDRLNQKLKAYEATILESLENDLQQLTSVKGAESLADQGAEQFKKIRLKYQNVTHLLEQKFNTGEMAYARFVGSAEQVYLSALDNLKQAASTLKSASSIDLSYISKKIKELSKKSSKTDADTKEIDALRKRLSLWEEQVRRVGELLSMNEEAMTRMEEASSAISALDTGSKFASTDLETAMEQLQELAKRAPVYNKS
jgi:hypothetical protein